MTQEPQKRQRRKKDRPDEIIAAALAEFAEKGFARASLGGIARRAGISRTTIYLYFTSKDEVFEAAAKAMIGGTIDQTSGLISSFEGSFDDLFAAVITTIYTKLIRSEAVTLLKVLIAEGHQFPQLVVTYRDTILRQGETALARMIDYGIQTGDLSPAMRNHDHRVIMAPVIFTVIWDLVFGAHDPLDLDRFRDSHIAILLNGLKSADGDLPRGPAAIAPP